MKRFAILSMLSFIFATMLYGCGWVGNEMVSVEPFHIENSDDTNAVIEVLNYNQMQDAVVALVEGGVQNGILSAPNHTSATVHVYMDNAIRYATNNTPIGAYAVEKITYEVGVRAGVNAIAMRIHYSKDLSQMMRIKNIENMQAALPLINGALSSYEDGIVFRVTDYESFDVSSYIEEFGFYNPDVVVSQPKVSVSVYPDIGNERIVDIQFKYMHDKETMIRMQNTISPVFTAAQLYVIGATQTKEKYAQLYSFLMERADYTYSSTQTPAYSIINDASGDSVAFAQVYAAMCRNAGLECEIISGTRNGEKWMWNRIRFQDQIFHLDLLHSYACGEFTPLAQNELVGYEWTESDKIF